MKINRAFSFDEEKDAEEIIKNGFEDGKIDYGKIYLVAKYIRQNLGYGAVRLERELIKFCKAQDKNFNPITEAGLIKKWVNSAMKYELKKVNPIFISSAEIDFLKTARSIKDRKILFVTLVLAKAIRNESSSQNYYIKYSNILDVVRLSKLKKITEIDVLHLYSDYKDHFTFYSPEKELIKVNYADTFNGTLYVINDLNDIMSFYESTFGEEIQLYYCEKCGKEIIRKSNRQRVCEHCSLILAQERTRRWREKDK